MHGSQNIKFVPLWMFYIRCAVRKRKVKLLSAG